MSVTLKKIWGGLLAASGLLAAGPVRAQQGSPLTVVPAQPRAGSVVTVRYARPAARPAAAAPLKGVAYLYTNFAWQTDSLVLAPTQGGWQATYRLPPGCAFAALRFVSAATPADSLARQGYYLVPRDKRGHRLPGGAIAEAMYRMPALGSALPPGFPSRGTATPADLRALLTEELARKGASPKQFVQPYLAIEHVLLGPDFARQAAPLLAPLVQEPLPTAEADLAALRRVYHYELKDEAKARELEVIIRQRYPRGEFARLTAFGIVGTQASPPERLRAAEQFLADFPLAQLPASAQGQRYIYYELDRLLASTYFDAGAFDKLLAMRARWNFRTENEVYRWNITRAYMAKTVAPDSLYRVATALLQDLLAKAGDDSYRTEGIFGDEAQAREAVRTQLDERLNTHLLLLVDLHRYSEALGYFARLSPQGQYADAALNEKHVQVLEALHKPTEAVQVLERSVRANAVTPAMSAKLRQAYQASHPGAAGYEAYLTGLRSQDEIATLHAYVEHHLLRQEYQPFAIEDASGQLVRSSDWGDKIVVLDFWATWCGPCIRAFPGMQLLVDKYAQDPLVEVYFVGTMQFDNYKEKDINYVKQQGYRFKLLFDGLDPRTGQQNEVFRTFAPLFNSSGIPRKVIVKDGVIRYTSEGYSGSPSQLVDELSYAIELLKKG